MADVKISQLPVAATPLTGTELVPVVQGGVTDQTTVGAILTGTVPSGTANGVAYLNGSKALTTGSALQFDGSNLGLGVTPSGWGSAYKALDIGGGASIAGLGNNTYITSNSYDNGTNYIYKASAAATLYLAIAGQHRFYTAPSGTAGNAISFTQAMTLDASGNLIVGGAAAEARLHAVASNPTNGVLQLLQNLSSSSQNGAKIQYDVFNVGTSGVGIPDGTANALAFFVGGITSSFERARIDASGNLLVGTTTQRGRVTIEQDGSINDCAGFNNTGTGTGSQSVVSFFRSGTFTGNISNTNTATAYNTSSDYRLKDNPQPLTNSGVFIDALQPKTWAWKADGSRGVGFIAHEVQAVSPGSVVGEKDAVDADGKPIMQAMEYGSAEFIANIVAELQSLRARVAQLETAGV